MSLPEPRSALLAIHLIRRCEHPPATEIVISFLGLSWLEETKVDPDLREKGSSPMRVLRGRTSTDPDRGGKRRGRAGDDVGRGRLSHRAPARADTRGAGGLGAWRRGDDSVYEISESADRALADAENALFQAGLAARPDLQTRLGGALSADEIERTLNEVRRAGAEAVDQS